MPLTALPAVLLQVARQVVTAMSLVHPHVLATYAYEMRPLAISPQGLVGLKGMLSSGPSSMRPLADERVEALLQALPPLQTCVPQPQPRAASSGSRDAPASQQGPAVHILYLVHEYCNLGDVAGLLASGSLAGGACGPHETAAAALGIAWMAGAGLAHAHAHG